MPGCRVRRGQWPMRRALRTGSRPRDRRADLTAGLAVPALVTEPGHAHTTRVEDVPAVEAREGEVLLRTLEWECAAPTARFPKATSGPHLWTSRCSCSDTSRWPSSSETATASARGQLVTATVRRSCGHCLACAEESPDLVSDRRLQRTRHHTARRLRPRARRRGSGATGRDSEIARPSRRARRADIDLRARAAPCSDDRRPAAVAARARAGHRRRRDRPADDVPPTPRRTWK